MVGRSKGADGLFNKTVLFWFERAPSRALPLPLCLISIDKQDR